MPRGTGPEAAGGSVPGAAPPPRPPRGSEDASRPPGAAQQSGSHTSRLPPVRQPEPKGEGTGRRENFLLNVSFQRVQRERRENPDGAGAGEVGGGEPPSESFNGREGEGSSGGGGGVGWRSRPGSGVKELRRLLGSGSCRRPPLAWHTKRLPRSALTRSFVFSIRASWVGVVRAPQARGAPSPSWGAGTSPRGNGDSRGAPAGPRPAAAAAAPGFPPFN